VILKYRPVLQFYSFLAGNLKKITIIFIDDGVHLWIAPVICFLFILMLPVWIYLAHHNRYTHTTLYTGWSPVIIAMCISR